MVIDIEIDEMKRTVKTEDDARSLALKEVGKTTREDYVTVGELMKKENEIRKAYGLKEIDRYPVFEMEYSPATGQSVWKKIVGVKIIRKPSQIPYGEAIYEDMENFDPSRRLNEIMPEVEARIDRDFPSMNFSKEEKEPIVKMIRLSVIKKVHLEAGTGKDTPLPDYLYEDEKVEEAPKPKKLTRKKPIVE